LLFVQRESRNNERPWLLHIDLPFSWQHSFVKRRRGKSLGVLWVGIEFLFA